MVVGDGVGGGGVPSAVGVPVGASAVGVGAGGKAGAFGGAGGTTAGGGSGGADACCQWLSLQAMSSVKPCTLALPLARPARTKATRSSLAAPRTRLRRRGVGSCNSTRTRPR